ncbi:MAG: ABC transporter permease [Planctomycetota bacterium]|nr:ABC transporter permease [Planctomycetota bacterium]
MALPLRYHWLNLFARKTTTLLTILVIAAVVGVFGWMMGFHAALRDSLSVAGDSRKLIVIKRGSTAESNSAVSPEEFNRLHQLSDVQVDPETGERLISPEMLVQVSLPRLRDGGATFANVAVRGVTKSAFKVHQNVSFAGNRTLGSREVIVGRAAAEQFGGLEIGETINLGHGGNRPYEITGYFSADGGPMESEIWGDLHSLMNSYNRSRYSSASLRLVDGADATSVLERIEGPAIQLTGATETDYWDEQAKWIRIYIGIAGGLVAVMSLAAIFSIANTMYSMVAGRTREVAMLRTIGYSGGQVLWGFLIESVLLSLIGGVLGCLACGAWLSLVGNTKDMFGATTFTTLAFKISMNWRIVLASLILVSVVGVCGALLPAVRAARLEVVAALREP